MAWLNDTLGSVCELTEWFFEQCFRGLDSNYAALLRASISGQLETHRRVQLGPLLDIIFEDNRLNVYAGELEVRPPGAPTIRPVTATLPVVLDALTPICATLG